MIRTFSGLRSTIPPGIPIVLETLIDQGQSTIETEIERTRESLTAMATA